MDYRVLLIETEEGFSAFVPALPGCISEGDKQTEAMENIREAATLWLDCGGTPSLDGGQAEEAELRREAQEEGYTVHVHRMILTVAA